MLRGCPVLKLRGCLVPSSAAIRDTDRGRATLVDGVGVAGAGVEPGPLERGPGVAAALLADRDAGAARLCVGQRRRVLALRSRVARERPARPRRLRGQFGRSETSFVDPERPTDNARLTASVCVRACVAVGDAAGGGVQARPPGRRDRVHLHLRRTGIPPTDTDRHKHTQTHTAPSRPPPPLPLPPPALAEPLAPFVVLHRTRRRTTRSRSTSRRTPACRAGCALGPRNACPATPPPTPCAAPSTPSSTGAPQ
eukprot:689678-Rhodomonas_salina.4